jgi:hypothetical protein
MTTSPTSSLMSLQGLYLLVSLQQQQQTESVIEASDPVDAGVCRSNEALTHKYKANLFKCYLSKIIF